MPQLIKLLDHKRDLLRYEAALALGEIGGPAIPALIEKFRRTDPGRTRLMVILALGKIGPDAQVAVPLLEKALRGINVHDKYSQRLIREALQSIRTVPESRIDDKGRQAAIRMPKDTPGARGKGRMGEGSLLIRENQNDGGMPGGGHRGDSSK